MHRGVVIPKNASCPLTTEFLEDALPDLTVLTQRALEAAAYDAFRRVVKKHKLNVEPEIPLSERLHPQGYEYFYTLLLISHQLYHNLSHGLPLEQPRLGAFARKNSRYYKAVADCTYMEAIFTELYSRRQIQKVAEVYDIAGRIFFNSFGSGNLIGIVAQSISQEAEHYIDMGRDVLFDMRQVLLSGKPDTK